MKYLAVIFDLFGTLVDNFSTIGYENTLIEMASILGLPPINFKQMWYENKQARDIGNLKGCESRIEFICNELGQTCNTRQIKRATKIRLDYIRVQMQPRPDVINTLSLLRENGVKLGLVSDCSHEVPIVWPETILAEIIDAPVFSCKVGFRKPDSRIYQLVIQQLHVRPEYCLYVGDGGSGELAGAGSFGMQPILFRIDSDSTEKHLINREKWDGPQINRIYEILSWIN